MPESRIVTLADGPAASRRRSGVIVMSPRAHRELQAKIFGLSSDQLGKAGTPVGWLSFTDWLKQVQGATYDPHSGQWIGQNVYNDNLDDENYQAWVASLPTSAPAAAAPAPSPILPILTVAPTPAQNAAASAAAAAAAAADAAQAPVNGRDYGSAGTAGQTPTAIPAATGPGYYASIDTAAAQDAAQDPHAAGAPLGDFFSSGRRRSGVVVRNSRPGAVPRGPSASVQSLAENVAECCDDEDEQLSAGQAYENLAALTLARKLRNPRPIGNGERKKMLRDAGMPGVFYANPATEAIFSSPAESLGKGGVIGSITHAVTQVTNTVKQVAAPVTNIVNDVTHTAVSLVHSTATAVQGVGQALSNADVGIANGLAGSLSKFASSPAALSAVGGALGIPIPGPMGAQGASGSGPAPSYDQYGNELPAAPATNWAPVLLLGGGGLLLYLLTSKRR